MHNKAELERARKRVILALDVKTLPEAESLVKLLTPYVGMFKVGLELLTAEGAPRVVELIHSLGGKVFYDGKFDDIPNTIGEASKCAARLGVKIFNAHASSGIAAMRAAVANKGRSKVYFVSVLTSIDETNTNIIFGNSTKATVLQMAKDIVLVGGDGIICSPQELSLLGEYPEFSRLKRITPGVRPAFAQVGDQKRVMTPAEAIKAGATYLVIGRPITKPDNGLTSEEAAEKILGEIAGALGDESKAREERINTIFMEANAIITNSHLVYASGKHGDAYVNKDAIYPHTAKIAELCSYTAENFENEEIDAVIGPVVGGVALSQWTAHHLSNLHGKEVLALCADKVDSEGRTDFVIKRGQDSFIAGKRILVVEDVLTTGGSVKKVVEAVQAMGGIVIGVGALCNRGAVTAEQIGNVPRLEALMNVTLTMHEEAECPLCVAQVPINTKVGKGAEFLKKKEVIS